MLAERSVNRRVTLLIADDHPVFREGLTAALSAAQFDVLGEAATGEEAIRMARIFKPDVVLMDIRLPGIDGLEAMRSIKSRSPLTPVIILTAYENTPVLWEAFLGGAAAYLLKGMSGKDIAAVIQDVIHGEQTLDTQKLQGLITAFQSLSAQMRPQSLFEPLELTPKESQVLASMKEGLTNRQIAGRLGIGLSTIKSHIYHLFQKIKVSDRTQAILWATVNGVQLTESEGKDGAASSRLTTDPAG